MKWAVLFSTALVTGLMFTSCKKNNSDQSNGNGQPQVGYQIKASNTSSGLAQKGTANANIIWTSGFAFPRKIEFEAKQNDLKVEFTSTADQQIDLMAPTAATFGNFVLPAGTYDEVELKIYLDKKANDPAMELNGTFTNNTTTIPVQVKIDKSFEIKTESENVVITDNDSYIAVTEIDLNAITSGITETMLLNANLTNGTVVISSNSNVLLYHVIADNLSNRHHHCHFEHHGH